MALRLSSSQASVVKDVSNKPLSIFLVIDTMEGKEDLQNAARATWLHAVKEAGHDYRFFMFSDAAPSADMIRLPLSTKPEDRYPRERYLLRTAFGWI